MGQQRNTLLCEIFVAIWHFFCSFWLFSVTATLRAWETTLCLVWLCTNIVSFIRILADLQNTSFVSVRRMSVSLSRSTFGVHIRQCRTSTRIWTTLGA